MSPHPLQDRAAWRPALVLPLVALLIMGLSYSLLGTGLARAAFPDQATGSLLRRGDTVIGSALVAQPFTGDAWFHPRPSAAGYDPMSAAGSNQARSNPEAIKRVDDAIAEVARAEGVPPSQVPTDMVTESGGGLDPDISPAAARIQVARVARARGMSLEKVTALVQANTAGKQFGVFGQPRVNVLKLNLALEAEASKQ
ncbi:potassium-transporting ATPase subunit KdpC [Pseudoxanthomonas sp. JBR18]|uniref:potassium-transporting ATPase subunit KdpC n=1 Tax=Pseudoxanthomonas sp. JBR18 TaxID=2969308 RepID=UPI0023058084|nr:potassium-transporting ATPase subunit KdpC [Pseudoxanthomonas sp. JBR18]WCE05945.1 potassium-transporting ATPase subunit KdpC [Pseudoxanthomonas sp. JBR18]